MRSRLMVVATAIAVVAVSVGVFAAVIPARATFRDALADRIQSDTFGPYENEFDCVLCRVSNNAFFLRTLGHTCATPGGIRKIRLDFSDAVSRPAGVDCSSGTFLVDDAYGQPGALNICGINDLPDVRVIANSLFARNASGGTPVLLPFSLSPDFSNTAFSLEFEQNVSVFGDPANAKAREMEAGATAIAELYKNQAKGAGGKVSLGRYRMPFRLRVEQTQ